MIDEKTYNEIINEDERRKVILAADYDPITGEGLDLLLEEKRVALKLSDYAIPVQWLPEEMMKLKLFRDLKRLGSIDAYIQKKKWKDQAPTHLDIERLIRKTRHKYDFCNWAYWCIRIDAKLGGRIRFKLNYPQLRLVSLCEKLRRQEVPIDVVILKARQWGGSTVSFFYQLWLALKHDPYHNFTIAAQVGSTAETILSMLKKTIGDYPSWDLGLPEGIKLELARRGTTNNAYVIKDNAHKQVWPTTIFIGSAEKPESLRGNNVHGAHYSEVGIWPDTPEKRPEALVADISGGMTKRHLDMQVMESTAKSSDDFFHEVWMGSLKGSSSYNPLFIPWFNIPHDSMPIKEGKEEFVNWLYENKDNEQPTGKWKDAGKHYWWLWELGATLEGINWYRYKRLDFTSYMQMANEAPSTWQEAFTSAGLKVFDVYEVQRMHQLCSEPAYRGELMSDGLTGGAVLNNIYFHQRKDGRLKIWEFPDDSPIENRYAVAVDIGGPRDTSDWSVIRVIDRLMMMPEFGLNGKPQIVAEQIYHTSHEQLAYDAMRIAAWYNNALLIIESNTVEMANKEREVGGLGSEYILDIVSDIYPNQYRRHNNSEDVGDKPRMKWGFRTDGTTKPKIIHHLQACVHDMRWEEPSEICCEELGQYIQHDGNKFDAPPKRHDDVLMATAILLWVCFQEMDIPTWIRKRDTRKKDTISSDDNAAVF